MDNIALLQSLGVCVGSLPLWLAISSTLRLVPPLPPSTPQGLVDLMVPAAGLLTLPPRPATKPFPAPNPTQADSLSCHLVYGLGESLCGMCCLQNPKEPIRRGVFLGIDEVKYSSLSSVLKETSDHAPGQYEKLH